MDGSSDVPTFDDGLYHPGTKSSAQSSTKHSPPSTATDPDATTIVSAAPAEAAPVDPPAATPTSLPTPAARKSKHADAAAIPFQSFATDSNATSSASAAFSSSSPMPTPEDVVSGGSIGVMAPPLPQHHSPRVAVIALVSILGTLVVVGLLVGVLSSQRLRRWREGRRVRYRETKWKISRPVREEAPGSMGAVGPRVVDISTTELLYGPVDPFARSIPRLAGRMPPSLAANYRHADPVEEMDQERGWLWGTHRVSSYTHPPRFVTPGLGVGKYRSKRGRQPSLPSQPSPLDADIEIKEELLYSDDEASSVSEYDDDTQAMPSRPLTGASYLLGRLKESIKSRSGLGSLGSSSTRNLPRDDESCGRGRWDEVGQLVDEDEKARRHLDYDDSKGGEAYLSQLVLPELPAITWDDHSGLKLASTKRTRAPSLDVEFDIPAPVQDLPPRRSPAARDPSSANPNSVRQLVSRLEEKERPSSASAALLPSPQSSSRLPPRRKRKEALVPARLPSLVSRPNNSSSSPSSSSSSRILRTAGPKLAHGLVKHKSKHLYPGGYHGRSPTKKLRRKDPPVP